MEVSKVLGDSLQVRRRRLAESTRRRHNEREEGSSFRGREGCVLGGLLRGPGLENRGWGAETIGGGGDVDIGDVHELEGRKVGRGSGPVDGKVWSRTARLVK